MNKYGLALHTSTPELGLAISNFSTDRRSSNWDLGRDISTFLHQYLVEFIAPQNWADIAFIAVAKGPGGFTGTRIGVVTARTLAQQLNIPLFAISTLAAIAWEKCQHSEVTANNSEQEPSNIQNKAIALQMPAQRGQLFAAIYQPSPTNSTLNQLFADTVITPSAWQQTLDTWPTPYQLIDIPAGVGMGASVTSLLELAYLDWQQEKRPQWSEALPFYGQSPVDDKAAR
jgi:tRNA threonylcarbamoyl adenosine modification protein YeaZ